MSSDPSRPQYEFTDDQSRVVVDLASGLRLVGVVLFLFGVLQAATVVTALSRHGFARPMIGVAVLMAAAALVYLSLGWWFGKASGSFVNVAATQGRDVDHLMDALGQLRNSFALLRAIIIAYAILMVIGILLFLFLFVGRAPQAA